MVEIAGVDVGKANLDVSVSEGPVFRFDNTAKGNHQVAEAPYGAGVHHGRV